MKAEQAKDPEKAKAGKERFVKILKGCGFNGLVALAGKTHFQSSRSVIPNRVAA
jgi:hypothetical protein